MSSNDIAISVDKLSKRYEIYDKPSDRLKQFLLPRWQRQKQQYFREFWALQNVSFEVKKGETVGIIGRNGSGKSTLLQIICGTLSPSSGTVLTNGRIAALLELGSGFNPEFTGRENVYMSAAVLGLGKEEIDTRFDAIAAFADIGMFIDQPVKTYSSGMYVRLAFSVIAHVDADILVVDEALSVGDAVFNQKCMRFIRNFQEQGTLLFVSHDMGAIQNLCKSALWLGNGQVQQTGFSKEVAEAYLHYTLQEVYGDKIILNATASDNLTDVAIVDNEQASELAVDYGSQFVFMDNASNASGWKTGSAEIVSLSLEKLGTNSDAIFEGGEKVCLHIRAKATDSIERPILGFVLRDRLGQDIFGENTLAFTALNPSKVSPGQEFVGQFIFRLPMLPNGEYALMASVADGNQFDNVQHHYMHDAFIVNVSSSKIRFGLVGIPFEQVSLEICDA
jgi:lipopolysaccharide transport system ATP-binding protein